MPIGRNAERGSGGFLLVERSVDDNSAHISKVLEDGLGAKTRRAQD